METYIAYFDETGDDGITTASSDVFVLTSAYMNTDVWQNNYDNFKLFRKGLKERYGMHVAEEMHTMHFLRDKGLYRPHGWSVEQRRQILTEFAVAISRLNIKVINVVIDKNNIVTSDYDVLKKALTYNIQRIENDSSGQWRYLVISDQGRIAPMRRTARELRAYNPVASHFGGITNIPVRGMIEDILEKNSAESYFIQICDFISCFVNLYYKYVMKQEEIPKRIRQVADTKFVSYVLSTFQTGGILNEKASSAQYGFVIYPRK